MRLGRDTAREPARLWRWLMLIFGLNVLLVLFGFLVPAGNDQINIAAVQHLLRSQESIGRTLRPTVAYVQTEEPLSPEARESLIAYASFANVDLRWLGDDALMALEAERNIDNGGFLFSLSAPVHGLIFSSIDTETSAFAGGSSSQLVFFHWMGVSEVWQEQEVSRAPASDT